MIVISPEQARIYMLGQLRLNQFQHSSSREGLRDLLGQLRCIQLDPLSPMGTSPDMVALARVEDYQIGDLFKHLMPGEAFEHFAKERCLLPAYAYPYYRGRALQAPWWRLKERLDKVTPEIIDAVLKEVIEHGPINADAISDHGKVEPVDWSGWKGTAKAAKMALEILWTRCAIIVSDRSSGRGKIYDIPQRALGPIADAPVGDYGRWALTERVEAAGLLVRTGGPHWSMLEDIRKSELPDQMIQEGSIEEVQIEGTNRRYLAPVGFRDRIWSEPDQHMRILGPLDPLIWNRDLVQHIFGFEYLWEVYKPAHLRRWGWYVCPLLHQGQFVGRLEGRVQDGVLTIQNIWKEDGRRIDPKALDRALRRHARACGAKTFTRPRIPR